MKILFHHFQKPRRSWFSDDPAREGRLTTEETLAIILSLSIAFILVTAIAFFLWRGNRRLKKARAEHVAARSRARNNHISGKVCCKKEKFFVTFKFNESITLRFSLKRSHLRRFVPQHERKEMFPFEWPHS